MVDSEPGGDIQGAQGSGGEKTKREDPKELLRRIKEEHRAELDRFFHPTDLKEMWESSPFLTAEQLEAILLSSEFGEKVVEALQRTDQIQKTEKGLALQEKEFGFFVYGDSFDPAKELHVSPLFQGDERSINLTEQGFNHLDQNSYLGEIAAIRLHTHPSVKNKFLDLVGVRDTAGLSEIFSDKDLINFRRTAERENPGVINAIGYNSRLGREELLLASFGNFEDFQSFDPEAVAKKAMTTMMNGGDYLGVYRDAGLNVAVLPVDMSAKRPFNEAEVRGVSRIIANRAHLSPSVSS